MIISSRDWTFVAAIWLQMHCHDHDKSDISLSSLRTIGILALGHAGQQTIPSYIPAYHGTDNDKIPMKYERRWGGAPHPAASASHGPPVSMIAG
jgi:hypothetical protein